MPTFLIVLGLLLAAGFGAAQSAEKSLQLPPETLAQWYKPLNKRQVWLHNMFKLRREMQAVSEYTRLQDQGRLQKWSGRLLSHYRKITEMVPEWQDELNLGQAKALQLAVERGDFEAVRRSQRKLGQSCKSCHREFRALAALIYRTPDFSSIEIAGDGKVPTQPYAELMQSLSVQVNRIKIASEDGRGEAALDALQQLQGGLQRLGESCAGCHKGAQPRERILGAAGQDELQLLQAALLAGEQKQVGRHLGSAAVIVCARCHAVHRIGYDLKQQLAVPR